MAAEQHVFAAPQPVLAAEQHAFAAEQHEAFLTQHGLQAFAFCRQSTLAAEQLASAVAAGIAVAKPPPTIIIASTFAEVFEAIGILPFLARVYLVAAA